ncbi:MAG: GNAT family protein [Pseudomonas sp.]|nr:GNAT family protein [Pseudomonas sp.]
MWIASEALCGKFVTLEVLESRHIAELENAVRDGELWTLWYATVPRVQEMAQYVLRAIEGAQRGDVAFAVRDVASQLVVGTTRYYNVDARNRRALIGYTWFSASAHRSPINTESKLLMMEALFEAYAAIAVEFRTHFFNRASRAAIERLGAKQDGILRNHQIMQDGSYRDTVVYSIVAAEWPAVKMNLQSKLV